MDDYTREMMDLKTLVTRTLEKKGVLAKIRAELRASVFEAIEEEDRVIGKDEGLPPPCWVAVMSELNSSMLLLQQNDSWKSELKDFSSKNGYDLNRNGDSGPLLLDVLEGFLKFENLSQARNTGRRTAAPEIDSMSNMETRGNRRSSSAAGGLPPLGRPVPGSQTSDRRSSSSMSNNKKDDYNWRYSNEENSEDVNGASSALENLQLDRKARNLMSSWRNADDGRADGM